MFVYSTGHLQAFFNFLHQRLPGIAGYLCSHFGVLIALEKIYQQFLLSLGCVVYSSAWGKLVLGLHNSNPSSNLFALLN